MRHGRRLKWVAATTALAGAGAAVAVASGPGFGAIAVTLPTVTVSTPVTTTTVAVTTPTVLPPAPPPPVTVTVPHIGSSSPPPPPPPPPASPPSSSGSGGGGSAPASGSGGFGASGSGTGGTSSASGAYSGRGSGAPSHRTLPVGGRHHRTVTLVFHVARKGTVRVFVIRIGCGVVGSFQVRAHPGVNRIRFRGRLHGQQLPAGKYRLRLRSHGKTVLRQRVVVAGPPAPCAPLSDTFAAQRAFALAFGGGSGSGSGTGASGAAGSPSGGGSAGKTAAGPGVGSARVRRAGILGVRASKIIPGSGKTQVALLIVLLCAIVLLAIGAVPRRLVPHAGAAAFLARRRPFFALAGLAALTAFLVSYFVA